MLTILLSLDPMLNKLIFSLRNLDEFFIKHLELLHFFLGVEAVLSSTGLFLSWAKYIRDIYTYIYLILKWMVPNLFQHQCPPVVL